MPTEPTSKKISVLVVTPVYNEEKVLEKNIGLILNYIRKLSKYKFKVLIADNGSWDNTQKIGTKLSKKFKNLVYYMRISQKGRGCAIREAWKSSNEDILCYMDIDLSTSLKDLDELIKHLSKGTDLVIGSRYMPNSVLKRSFFRYIISKCFNFIIPLFLKTNLKDMQCGFKGITKKSKILLKETKENSWFFDTELVLLAKERGLSVEEIPVRWIENRHGTKIRVFNDLFELVLFIFSFKKRLKKQCIEKKQKAF